MNAVLSSLYTAAMTLCLFSAGVLGRPRERAQRGVSWLTWFLVIEAANFACELLMAHPDTPLKNLWLGLRLAGALFIAPCLWLAVREAVQGIRPHWHDLGRNHLLAIAAGAFCTIPLVAESHWGTTYANPGHPVSRWHSFAIHTTMLICIGVFAVQAPVFLRRCRQLFQQCTPRGASSPWLQWLLPIVATTWALGLLRTIQCATHAPRELTVLFALTEVGVTVGAIYVLIRRASAPIEEAIVVEPVMEIVVEPAVENEPESLVESECDEKYARSSLTPVIRKRITRKLEQAVTRSLHIDSEISLRKLCAELKENAHYVSQVINQDLGSSFYDWINQHRIARAKELLKESPGRSVIEIALAVGFNSKSTFNTAFRRHAGMTPTTFRATEGK